MMSSHWLLILPLLIPAMMAPIIVLAGRHDIFLSRVFSLASVVSLIFVNVFLLKISSSDQVHTYSMGNWTAPFGIVLVLDRLSALMVALTSVIGFAVLLYAIQGWDTRGKHFHTLFQFQIMGINGAFLTGDLFNLFVFFEVLLIASYGLMVHGGGASRIRAGVQYVIINLVGSSFFLIAAGLIYSVTGTLNMADIALQVAKVAPANIAILNTGAILLLLVFLIKSAFIPFHFWLPGTYSNAPGPVAALFALLTKVGAYCILRVYILIFPEVISSWIVVGALLTLIVGALGVLAAKTLGQLVSFYMVSSMGTLLLALGQFTTSSVNAGLYYLLHSTFMAALLFLIVDLVRVHRTTHQDSLNSAPPFSQMGLLSTLFFVAAIGAVGMPPLSGFIGKLMILQSALSSDLEVWIWTTILLSSLILIIGFARAGSGLFWKSHSYKKDPKDEALVKSKMPFIPVVLLLSGVLFLTAFSTSLSNYLSQITLQLMDSKNYTDAVLTERAERL